MSNNNESTPSWEQLYGLSWIILDEDNFSKN